MGDGRASDGGAITIYGILASNDGPPPPGAACGLLLRWRSLMAASLQRLTGRCWDFSARGLGLCGSDPAGEEAFRPMLHRLLLYELWVRKMCIMVIPFVRGIPNCSYPPP